MNTAFIAKPVIEFELRLVNHHDYESLAAILLGRELMGLKLSCNGSLFLFWHFGTFTES